MIQSYTGIIAPKLGLWCLEKFADSIPTSASFLSQKIAITRRHLRTTTVYNSLEPFLGNSVSDPSLTNFVRLNRPSRISQNYVCGRFNFRMRYYW